MSDIPTYELGQAVRVKDGTWQGKRGVIAEVSADTLRVTILFDHFSRIVPCQLEFHEIEGLALTEWDEELLRIRRTVLGT